MEESTPGYDRPKCQSAAAGMANQNNSEPDGAASHSSNINDRAGSYSGDGISRIHAGNSAIG